MDTFGDREKMEAKAKNISKLFYITHIENLEGILNKGIFSHSEILKENISITKVYNESVMNLRSSKKIKDSNTLWEYANLYFQPRNPMLYTLIKNMNEDDLCVLELSPDVLEINGVIITDGNAASYDTRFFDVENGLKEINKLSKILHKEYWTDIDGSSRTIMAEVLVPGKIPPKYIRGIYVPNANVKNRIISRFPRLSDQVIVENYMFFKPQWRAKISDRLSLIKSDMFFSRLQTITISVNTVGIMGKGLASRAKYQFPDVYVRYQDVCKSKSLRMGTPYLYKRESQVGGSYYDEFVEKKEEVVEPQQWFLLFPTKTKWQHDSDFEGIEEGMRWLVSNYKTEGIKSIALPALGCGLGNLKWEDVGPMMTKYLVQMDIFSAIYLPLEKDIDSRYLTSDFLLQNR